MKAAMTSQTHEYLEKALITKVKVFHQLLESGMLSGKLGSLEAKRRNIEIKSIRDALGLTSKEQTALVNKHSQTTN
jgi:hypothetical protein